MALRPPTTSNPLKEHEMTTVANQPVGPDSVSGSVAPGKKSRVGDRACFMTQPAPSDLLRAGGVYAGTLGGANGAGHGLPLASAPPLTKIESKHPGV
jgi:hypothetical protein